jgi:biopolymer transport protein TolR
MSAGKGNGMYTSTGDLATPQYTHADLSYVRKKRRGRHAEEEEEKELNIVPYLDILINLIMFLLVAQAAMVHLGLIDVTAPSYAAAGPSDEANDDSKKQLRLTVGVASSGFFIAGKGGVLPGEEAEAAVSDPAAERAPTVPMRDNDFDYRSLTAKLRAIKVAYPDTQSVFIAADDNIPYEVIVKTLDATRRDSKGDLFPNVAFTQIR